MMGSFKAKNPDFPDVKNSIDEINYGVPKVR